jgi:hypothetical protein
MAIQRVPGQMLESNLLRTTNLAVSSSTQEGLLHLDVVNNRVGIKTSSPGNFDLDVNGTARFSSNVSITGNLTVTGETTVVSTTNMEIEDNILVLNSGGSTGNDAGLLINRAGTGNDAVFYWDEATDKFKIVTTTSDGSTVTNITDSAYVRLAGADPADAQDFVTKAYFEANSANAQYGTELQLGTPTDSSFGDGAYVGLATSDSVTDAIDDLNETMENIRNNTYVKSVDFTADQTVGGAGITVTLSITTVGGGADRYTIDWGTGETPTTATTNTTPSHTYNSNTNSPFTVTVTAYNNSATVGSAGSTASKTRSNYIVVYTATPVPAFEMYAGSSGGSAITKVDSGSTVYLKNNTTNTSGADVTYSVDWGDGSGTETIANDSASGGVAGTRLAHTYTNSGTDDGSTIAGVGAGDTRYRIRLVLESHSTANPSDVPAGVNNNFDVYSIHTPKIDVADSVLRGVNEESTSGFPMTFINGTDTNPGAKTTFTSNLYAWNFGEGDSATTVNVGSGSAGDTDQNISNTFNLSSGEQSNGTTQTYNVQLSLTTGHSNTPFNSAVTQIIVEPDVRANIAGTAVTISDKSGDNQYDLYDFTDLSGNNRALTRFTNTSQNADDYFYDYFDDSSSTTAVAEDGSAAGSIGATIDKNYTGTSNGNIAFRFRAHGTPDTIEQDDEATLTFTMNATPSAPSNLSTFTLSLADAAQGTTPKLCAGFDDASDSNPLSAGASLNTATARRYTSSTPIDTNVVNNAYNGASGTLTAIINGVDTGNKAFTTATGENGTFTSLIITGQDDAHNTISASTYPSNFYQTFDAKITQALSSYSVGVNDERLQHSVTGNTTYVSVVRDDITVAPTTSIGTVTQNVAGTFQYVSGVPYYDAGSPSLTVTGTTIANLTGQAYADISNPHEIEPGTVSEGSGSIISNLDFTYANIDGASTFLTGGIPNTDTGVASPYTIGAVTVPLTSSNMFSVSTIKARSTNCNGAGAYSASITPIAVFTATPLGLNKENGGIVISDSLGATYDDDAVRIADFIAETTDTPTYNGATNFYTNDVWSGAEAITGTREAVVVPATISSGVITHNQTDYSARLPAGPNLSTGRTGTQYYTFAFRRTNVNNFTVTLSGTVSGLYIALPGTDIDSTSGLNGWVDASITYAGSGAPGTNTGAGGNGSNGCASGTGDRIIDGTSYSNKSSVLTLGTVSSSNATGNVILVRIKLESGDSVSALSIS